MPAQKSELKLKKSFGPSLPKHEEDFSRADFTFENLDEIVKRTDEAVLNKMVAQSLTQANKHNAQSSSTTLMVRGFSHKKLPTKLETTQGEIPKAEGLAPDEPSCLFCASQSRVTESLRQLTDTQALLIELDWQVSKAKHIITKYKDLVVKMQLQINAHENTIQLLKLPESRAQSPTKLNSLLDEVKP